jgi:FkbM family methyltransferase
LQDARRGVRWWNVLRYRPDMTQRTGFRRVLAREWAFGVLRALERRDIVGAWRVRQLIEATPFGGRGPDPLLCSTDHDVDVVLQPFLDQGVEESIYRTGSYERGTLAVMAEILHRGDRFVDVGANVGLMSLVAARIVGSAGRVDAFEPLPEIRALLAASVDANRFTNVVINDFALGSVPSVLSIHRHLEVNRGSASLAWAGLSTDTLSVRVETMDTAVPRLSSQPIAMIKIDVEGWELEVLKGGTGVLARQPQPVLCIEFSRLRPLEGGQLEDMVSLLEELDYLPFRLKLNKSRASPLVRIGKDDLPEHDNVFFFPKARLGAFSASLFDHAEAP